MTTLKKAEAQPGDTFYILPNETGAFFLTQHQRETIRRACTALNKSGYSQLSEPLADISDFVEDSARLVLAKKPQRVRVIGLPDKNAEYQYKLTAANNPDNMPIFSAYINIDAFKPTLVTRVKQLGRRAHRFFVDDGTQFPPNLI